jgi:hypothetical protein
VVAEKFQAMVMLGIANTRMKDFYDVWMLSRKFGFEGKALGEAIKATFVRRETPLPSEPPVALSQEFYEDQSKQAQWRAFLRRSQLESEEETLGEVFTGLSEFLMPVTLAVRNEGEFRKSWPPAGPWRFPLPFKED